MVRKPKQLTNKYCKYQRARVRSPGYKTVVIYVPENTYSKLSINDHDLSIEDRTLMDYMKLKPEDMVLLELQEGSEDYMFEQEAILKWVQGYTRGITLFDLFILAYDNGLTQVGISYAIYGLMDKKLIDKRADYLYPCMYIKTNKTFRRFKGEKFTRKIKPIFTKAKKVIG